MNRYALRRLPFMMLLCLAVMTPLSAQDTAPPAPAPRQPAEPAVSAEPSPTQGASEEAPAARRDPFGTTDPMQSEAQRRRTFNGRNADQLELPRMVLRGYIEAAEGDQRMLALLELADATVQLVRVGDELSVQHRGASLKLTITAMQDMAVHIAIEPTGEKVIIR